MHKKTFILLVLVLMGTSLWAQTKGKAHDLRRDADQAYDRQQFEAAEEAYRRSAIIDPDEKGIFNLGNAIFNQSRYDEAARQYEKAISLIEDPSEQSRAWYNLGNAHYLNGKYDESVNAYKRALIASPDDLQAKQNLMMALREMKMEEQQQQQQQDQQQQQEENENEQQQQEQQQEQDQQQQNQQNQESDQQQPQEELEQKLTKDQAMQLLEIIDEEDQKVQEKLRKREAGEKKKTKDW